MLGVTPEDAAQILGCDKSSVLKDLKNVFSRWRYNAMQCSPHALQAFEEIEMLQSLARSLMTDLERAKDTDKAPLAEAAARALFYAGRLRQGGSA